MRLQGKLIAETPLYRGNARKTLFTRDGDGTHRLVSLTGEIGGTAEALMDAFIGQSRSGQNTGLLNQLWRRLYGTSMPRRLITHVDCKLQEVSYPPDRFFDLRMGIRLDEDRWAAEANANYKMETVFRNSAFDLVLTVDDNVLRQEDNQDRLYYLLQELIEGRFWFGAAKSKGLGRLRLEMDIPFSASATPPTLQPNVNHLTVTLSFSAANPLLVGWNWGKVDPAVPSFAAIEGRVLVGAMRALPDPIRERLELVLAGPILSPEDWKEKLAHYLPRVIAAWLTEQAGREVETWTLTQPALDKLSKGKHALSKAVRRAVQPLVGQPFPNREAADQALRQALGAKANMAKRILKVMTQERQTRQELDRGAWQEIANSLGLDAGLADQLAEHISDEAALVQILATACQRVLPQLYLQVDQQIKLLQSDAWVDAEIASRQEHLKIKTMLLEGKIDETQWGDTQHVPEGVSAAAWREFLAAHQRVHFRHLISPVNLRKSITNDQNFIAFLQGYRERVRQELVQPHNVDFRAGGPGNRMIAREYGKPYDTVFVRMLSWAPSTREEGAWEIYVPGSTIKGAFRKRASQVLKTLWGETAHTSQVLDRLFGTQGRRGLVFFSDAYLVDPIDPERAWCSMDGIKMDPATGRPLEAAKRDYLFAYGRHLSFRLRLDLQDIGEDDLEALTLLTYLLQDFQNGDIPLGGQKSSGFGWVKAAVNQLTWLTSDVGGITTALFGDRALERNGAWYRLQLEGEEAAAALQATVPLVTEETQATEHPPRAAAGFISHRAFGGYSGLLWLEVEVLTPLHIQESGEPSHTAVLDDGPVNGWDFFSMAAPEARHRPEQRLYALPSRSLRGMIRHIYAIASDSHEPAADISHLSPVEALFGWVGQGPNQALMSRIVFSFAFFDQPELAWFKVPYPYGHWRFENGQWREVPGSSAVLSQIAKTWRVYGHAPLAPIVQQADGFEPDTAQANYVRAVLPGARARFNVRFWNLEAEELQRLLWCLVLEPELAHKMGKHRYLGFGSLRLRLLPESHLIDWGRRYAGQAPERWQRPLRVEEWLDTKVVLHYRALRQALNAEQL